MDKGSVERLRYDRRLQRRLGWIDEADHKAYLASLPDVSEKMTTCAEQEKAAEEAAAAVVEEGPAAVTPSAPTPAGTPAGTPAATAGDFSAPSPFGDVGSESGGN